MSITAVITPDHGTAVSDNGKIKYTPAKNYNGPDTFTYTVSDGNAETDTAEVTIAVAAVNDAPTVAASAGGSCGARGNDQFSGGADADRFEGGAVIDAAIDFDAA